MTLFEPSPPDNRPPLHSKPVQRELGVVFFLVPHRAGPTYSA